MADTSTLQLTGDRLEFFAPCPRGAEKFLADELRALKCRSVRPVAAGVSFGGRLEHAYRALMWSRTASRVLLTLARVSAASADELYAAVSALPWEDHVRADGTIAVDATGVNAALRNTQFTAVRVKDAIADRFTARGGIRPSVDTVRPDLLVNVVVRADRATVSIDLAGEPLHRRGYREPGVQVAAPMKETLAAAVLLVAGWPEIAEAGGAFVDPMCGSGTLAIEAAMMAGDIAPGLLRERWGFSAWLGHDAGDWERVRAAAEKRREAGLAAMVPVAGYDVDPRAIEVAAACVARAGLEGHVSVERRAVAELVAPEGAVTDGVTERPGLVATNPPYGERIGERRELAALYAELAAGLREGGFAGWKLAVITPDAGLGAGLRMTPERTVGMYNGRIATNVSVFRVGRAGAPVSSAEEAERPGSAPQRP
ncbi:MAG: 23S rRNA (guanine(2445)-N(2))/(guanine(2069)-N(7))-methyltransferase, partial [Coriobacteriia bacterium]|nr:23S rRNA (guanine(2445)-N(2))/(guanine(2069)-N(7))-methyltransferase [Coriobacteriia bacterium]